MTATATTWSKSFDDELSYKYRDNIIGGEVITVPARRVYVKVRNNDVVHAYPLE